jgi:transposase-like protein
MKWSEKHEAKRSAKSEARERNQAAKPAVVSQGEPAKFAITSSLPLLSLFVVVSLIAAFAYGISAWQVYGFADHVWGLPLVLCLASAVIADLLSLAGLFATYLLRTAKLRVRAYAWFVFLLMTALSIAAAEAFAHWRTLDETAQKLATHQGGMASQVASGAVVVSLALAVHLLIVVRRHVMEIPTLPSAPASETRSIKLPTPPPIRPVYQYEKPIGPRPAPTPRPALAQRPEKRRTSSANRVHTPGDQRDEYARRVVERGEHPADIAAEVGKSTRSIELWVKAYRERHKGDPLAAMETILSGMDEKPQVNGHEFHPDEVAVN